MGYTWQGAWDEYGTWGGIRNTWGAPLPAVSKLPLYIKLNFLHDKKEDIFAGDTVRIFAEFYTPEDVLIDPDVVYVRTYGANRKPLIPYTKTKPWQRKGIGKYEFDYVLPMKNRKIYIKFVGELEFKPNASWMTIEGIQQMGNNPAANN